MIIHYGYLNLLYSEDRKSPLLILTFIICVHICLKKMIELVQFYQYFDVLDKFLDLNNPFYRFYAKNATKNPITDNSLDQPILSMRRFKIVYIQTYTQDIPKTHRFAFTIFIRLRIHFDLDSLRGWEDTTCHPVIF